MFCHSGLNDARPSGPPAPHGQTRAQEERLGRATSSNGATQRAAGPTKTHRLPVDETGSLYECLTAGRLATSGSSRMGSVRAASNWRPPETSSRNWAQNSCR